MKCIMLSLVVALVAVPAVANKTPATTEEAAPPADTASPSKFLLGIGNSSCSMWTTRLNGDQSLMNQAGGWVAGYLSGLNIGLRKAPDFSRRVFSKSD